MSAMPQMPKLTINTPITTAIMVLPSQFDEALRNPRSMGPTCRLGERNRAAPRCEGVHRVIRHHKEAESLRQPRATGPIEAANEVVSGTVHKPLLAHIHL